MAWGAMVRNLVELAVISIVGFGLAFYIGNVFITALPVNTVASSATTNILTGFGNAIATIFVPIIAILFILFLYVVVRSVGLLGDVHTK